MKLSKLFAIIVIIITFVTFFQVGLFFLYQEPIVKYVDNPIYIEKNISMPNRTITSALVYGLGVHEDNETGELVKINLSTESGYGRVLFDSTFHSYGHDLQDSMIKIITYIEKYADVSFENTDVTLSMNSEAHSVEGTSGGAAIGVALLSLVLNKTVIDDVVITGTLNQYGKVGEIAGLDVKFKVASDMGITKMLIPKSQCNEIESTDDTEVVCVSTLEEAAEEMLE